MNAFNVAIHQGRHRRRPSQRLPHPPEQRPRRQESQHRRHRWRLRRRHRRQIPEMMDPALDVTLVERQKTYTSCPLSNEVISGHGKIEDLQTGYDGLKPNAASTSSSMTPSASTPPPRKPSS
jgi:hypothetical protein